MKRKRIFAMSLLLSFVSLAAVGGWVASSSIVSPADVAARTAPPPPSPILIPVEHRVLSSNVITRGTARFGRPLTIAIVPSALKPNSGVITSIPRRNTQLKEGDVVLTASGRPVFVLQGEIPAYRDLVPGISGDDVRQLEEALKRLGYNPGPIDGTFDRQTSAAVADWYGSAGWQPFGPTAEQNANIRALEQQLALATNRKSVADDVAAAAPAAVAAARAKADHTNKVAAGDVLAKIAVRGRVMLDPRSTRSERNRADAYIEVSRAGVKSTKREGEVAVQAAVDAEKIAYNDTKLADAETVWLAADLDNAKQKAGVQVPVDEIVFISSVPVRVEQTEVVVGDLARGPVIKVTNNQLVIGSSLRLDEAPLVKPGMPVAIDERTLGIEAKGVVQRVFDTPGTHGVDGFHIYLEVRVDETPTALEGFSLRLIIPIESTGGAITAVPVSALSLAPDGTSRVLVDHDGELEFVQVKPGLSADGFVEVTPVDAELAAGQLVVVGYEKE